MSTSNDTPTATLDLWDKHERPHATLNWHGHEIELAEIEASLLDLEIEVAVNSLDWITPTVFVSVYLDGVCL